MTDMQILKMIVSRVDALTHVVTEMAERLPEDFRQDDGVKSCLVDIQGDLESTLQRCVSGWSTEGVEPATEGVS